MPPTADLVRRRPRFLLLAFSAVSLTLLAAPLASAGPASTAAATSLAQTGADLADASPVTSVTPVTPVSPAVRAVSLLSVVTAPAQAVTPVVAAPRRTTVSRAAVERAWSAPVRAYRLSARFGDAGAHWRFRHTGLDFVAPWGTAVYAVTDAVVAAVARHPIYGNIVVLETSPGVTLWYCHLASIGVGEGDRVIAGQKVGRVGATGNVTGAHLHLEVRVADRPTDPEVYLFGTPRGTTSTPPSWLPPTPITTVAELAG